MEDQLISFETAVLAKEKGFNVELRMGFNSCGLSIKFGKTKDYHILKSIYYSNEDLPYKENTPHYPETFICTAPTQSLLQKWLREVHSINVYCVPTEVDETKWYHNIANSFRTYIGSYEEALEEGLFQALKLIKNEDS